MSVSAESVQVFFFIATVYHRLMAPSNTKSEVKFYEHGNAISDFSLKRRRLINCMHVEILCTNKLISFPFSSHVQNHLSLVKSH